MSEKDQKQVNAAGDTAAEFDERAFSKRRHLMARAAMLGIPLILTIHSRALAQTGGGSGNLSGNMSGTQPTYP